MKHIKSKQMSSKIWYFTEIWCEKGQQSGICLGVKKNLPFKEELEKNLGLNEFLRKTDLCCKVTRQGRGGREKTQHLCVSSSSPFILSSVSPYGFQKVQVSLRAPPNPGWQVFNAVAPTLAEDEEAERHLDDPRQFYYLL